MAETKTQNRGAAETATATSAEVTVPTTPTTLVEHTFADRTTELAEQWLELATTTRRTAIGTTRAWLETIESLPLANRIDAVKLVDEFVDLVGHLAHMEYDALRTIVRSTVDVDVNVDVLREGVRVDVLSGGVNVDTLSRKGTS